MEEARSCGSQLGRVVKSPYLSQVLSSNPESATYCDSGPVTLPLYLSFFLCEMRMIIGLVW